MSAESSIVCRGITHQCGGIYDASIRKECDSTADQLKSAGIPAEAYHAGLQDNERINVQTAWTEDRCQVHMVTLTIK